MYLTTTMVMSIHSSKYLRLYGQRAIRRRFDTTDTLEKKRVQLSRRVWRGECTPISCAIVNLKPTGGLAFNNQSIE